MHLKSLDGCRLAIGKYPSFSYNAYGGGGKATLLPNQKKSNLLHINFSSKTFSSIKYVYLIIFFALLSGIFHPLITGFNFDFLITGILILFVGLLGSILLYKSITSETKRRIFFGSGFTLIAISLYYIFQITGRV